MSDEAAIVETPAVEDAAAVEEVAAEAVPVNDAVGNDVEPPAEGGEEAQTAEPPKDPKAEEKQERDTVLFNRSLKFREEATQKLQKVEQTLAEVRREKESFAKEKAEVERWRSEMARIKEDPYAIFEVLDIDPTDLTRKLVELNEPTARELARIRRENEEFKKKFEEDTKRREEEQRQIAIRDVKSRFVEFVLDADDEYPDVADADPTEVGNAFWQLATQHYEATGQTPPMSEVAKHLQAHLKKQAEDRRAMREARRQQRGARPVTTPALSEPGGGDTAPTQRTAANGQPANGPGQRTPKTLTNGSATHVASAPKESWTDEEVDAWSRAQLRALRSSLAE